MAAAAPIKKSNTSGAPAVKPAVLIQSIAPRDGEAIARTIAERFTPVIDRNADFARLPQGVACLLVDSRLPGVLDRLREAVSARVRPAIVVVVERGETGMAVAAMRAGADDCAERDSEGALVEAIVRAIAAPRRAVAEPAVFDEDEGTRCVVQCQATGLDVSLELCDRSRALAELQLSEERFRQVVETIDDVFWVAVPGERRTYVSPACASIWGRSAAELQDDPDAWFVCVHDEDRERVRAAFAAGAIAGRYDEEFRVVRPDGTLRWVRDRAFPIRDARGRVMRLCGLAEDITRRRLAENASRASEERLRLALRAGGMRIWEWDLEGGDRLLDDGVRALLSAHADSAARGPQLDHSVVHREDEDRLRNELRGLVERDAMLDIEFRVVRPGGEVRWLAVAGIVARDAEGRPQRVVGVNRDVTLRRRAAEALHAQELKIRRLFEANIVGVGFATGDRIADANDAFLQILGATRGDLTERPSWSTITAAEFAAVDADALAAVRERGRCAPYEKVLVRRDGTRVPVLVGMASLPGGGDDWVFFVVELTAQKHVEAELRARTRELIEADRRKDDFLAMLAHELRNPLAPIRTAVATMRRLGPDQPALANARDIVDRQVGHLSRIVDELLDVAGIVRGKTSLMRAPVSVVDLVSRAVEAARSAVEAKRQRLTALLPSAPLLVDGDEVRLAQVIANLLDNASKYTPAGGDITIEASGDEREARVAVRDTGIGIAPAMLPHVFELFVQADRSLDRDHRGLGIGLTLVRQLVELHGGEVSARSEGLGCGTEIVVRLPRLVESVCLTPEAGSERFVAAASGSGLRVLIVDDNRDTAESLALLLALDGSETRFALSGLEAIEVASTFRPDVIVLDIGLQGLDGLEVARRLRATDSTSDAVLIAATGYGDETMRAKVRAAGFDYHLVKPVDPGALNAVMASAVKRGSPLSQAS